VLWARVESAEAGAVHEAPQLVGFVEREHDPHERGHVGGEMRCQGVLEDGEDLGCGPWDEHQRPARRREDAAHLSQRRQAVGEELQPELAQHEVEGSVGERERVGGCLVPGDRRTAGRRGPSDRQHPGVEVDASDRALGPDTLGSRAGHDSRPAGDVQDPLTGPDPGEVDQSAGDEEQAWRHALTTVIAGFSAS
jgi:hypothetical protein